MANEKVAFQRLHVSPGPHLDVVMFFQQELMAALNNYALTKKSERKAAQATLMDQSKAATSLIQKTLDKESRAFADKTLKKGDEGYEDLRKTYYKTDAAPATRHRIADPVVQGFEVAYAASRTSKADILARIEQVASFHGYPGILRATQRGTPDNYYAQCWNGTAWVNLVELWFGSARFIETSEKGVFVHRTKPDRQYVQDRHGFFVARYLIRNMSDFDRKKVEGDPVPDPVLTAKSNRVPTETSLMEDITTHVRAKEASGGATCFLSFSHTKHMIVGSTAKQFYNQENGDILVDAAKVPRDALIDLHSLDAVKKLFGVSEVKPTLAFKEGDEAYEANAAARDTVRTREILIAGSVAKAAVVAVRLSTRKAKAAWTTLAKAPAVLPEGLPEAWTS